MNKPKKSGYSLVIILLAAVLFLNFSMLTLRITSKQSVYPYEYSTLIREVEKKDYPSLEDDLLYNKVRQVTTVQSTEQLQAIVNCQKALTLYRAYTLDDNVSKAEEQYAVYQANAAFITDAQLSAALTELEEEYLND